MTETKKGKATKDTPILIVTYGTTPKVRIGPRMNVPGYPTYLRFTPWDTDLRHHYPLAAIRLTKKWYEDYTKDKDLEEYANTYEKLLAYFEGNPEYFFGCEICGERLDTIPQLGSHLDGHRKQLNI